MALLPLTSTVDAADSYSSKRQTKASKSKERNVRKAASQKKKEEEEKAQNQAELEELRRRLAELEAQKGSSPEERGADADPQSEVKNGDEPR